MYALITVILVLISIFLVLIVLVQNPKGGGLGAGFGGGSSQAMGGVQKTTDFLEKATWTLVIVFLALSLVSNVFIPRADVSNPVEQTVDDILGEE